MSIRTALNIYRQQWYIEPQTALRMLDLLESIKGTEQSWSYRKSRDGEDEDSDSNYKTYQKFFATDRVVMCPDNTWDMRSFEGFDGATVAIIPISGPLMKSNYCGSLGTNTLKNLVIKASNTVSVQTILFLIDSPGGTVDGTESFANVIRDCGKETIALIDGMMCSAAYWIGSSCDKVIATSMTNIIGSIGTMCGFYDNTKAMEGRGYVLREYYATASKDKNAAMSDAEKGDGKKLIAETLDPLNDVFLSAVQENRKGKLNLETEDVLTGKTYTAKPAEEYGLIDGVDSLENVISEALSPKQTHLQTLIQTTKNDKKMTPEQILQAHPEAYNTIKGIGASEEKLRVKAWLAFKEIDPESVHKGIDTGASVDAAVIAEMSVKAAQKAALKQVEQENPADIPTQPANPKQATGEDASLEANQAALLKELGIPEKK